MRCAMYDESWQWMIKWMNEWMNECWHKMKWNEMKLYKLYVCPMFAFDDAVFYYIAYLLYDLLSLHLHIVRKLYFYFYSLSLSQRKRVTVFIILYAIDVSFSEVEVS